MIAIPNIRLKERLRNIGDFLKRDIDLEKIFLVFLFLGPTAYLSYLNRTFKLDDALIYSRNIRNFLNGSGLVFNPGERLNSLTSPLFSYILIGASYILGDIQVAAMTVSAIFMGATLCIFAVIFSRYSNRYIATLFATALACIPFFYRTFGMETTLFMFMIGACIYLFLDNRIFLLGIACSFLILTRSEGVFLILAMAIEHFRQRKPFPRAHNFIIPILLVVGNVLFNRIYYDSFLPVTGATKILQGQSGLFAPFFGVWILKPRPWLMGPDALFLYYGIAALAACGAISQRLRSINVLSIGFLCLYSSFYILLGIPGYFWYHAPFYPFFFFYAGVGLFWLFRQFCKTDSKVTKIAGVVLFTLLVVILPCRSLMMTKNKLGGETRPALRDIGLWIKENTPTNARLAVVEIGTIGWYSERQITDILGLVTPSNTQYLKERDFEGLLKDSSYDYLLINLTSSEGRFLGKGRTKGIERGDLIQIKEFGHTGYVLYMRKNAVKPIRAEQSSQENPGIGDMSKGDTWADDEKPE